MESKLSPQEKAKQLVESFKGIVYPYLGSGMLVNQQEPTVILENSKICAKMVCDEFIYDYDQINDDDVAFDFIIRKMKYWEAVKDCIDNVNFD